MKIALVTGSAGLIGAIGTGIARISYPCKLLKISPNKDDQRFKFSKGNIARIFIYGSHILKIQP